MPTPRRSIVDDTKPGVYHCISRCVRRAHLCGDGYDHRKEWIEQQIAFLTSVMAITVFAHQVLGNHLHALLRIRPDLAAQWSDREVAVRYLRICPGNWRRRAKGIPIGTDPTEEEIAQILHEPGRIDVLRKRLSSLSWFMAKLKEPVARRANAEDGCKGRFWEGRFRSFAVLDDEAIVATATYIDLNAVRAGLVDRPEDYPHGSIADRVAAVKGTDSRTQIPLQPIPGYSDARYVEHVDVWARVILPGKRSMKTTLPPILQRLGLTQLTWTDALLSQWDDIKGTAIGTAASLAAEAARRASKWICTPLHTSPHRA